MPGIKNLWIVKPGENTNRGHGITVCKSIDEVKNILEASPNNLEEASRTFIV